MTEPQTDTHNMPPAEVLFERLKSGVADLLSGIDPQTVHLVGIHSGGAWLAERLHRELALPAPMGTLDISFYRDDFDRIGLHSQVIPSDIPFPVAGRHLILVDDVLYTGRTIRAAMNELFDYGRPASIRLVVLIDRGGRQLPVCADFAAWRLAEPSSGSWVLARTDEGTFSVHIEPEAP